MVRLSYGHHLLLALSAALALAAAANAASVTPQVYVTFDGSLVGTAYTLGAGELDNSFTFSGNGSVSISGGVANIPGDTDGKSGFLFSGTDLAAEQGLGSVVGNNWISEALFCPNVPAASQPTNPQPGNHILDVQGDTFFRYDGFGNDPKIVDFGYYSSANDSEPKVTVADLPTGQFTHVALVWNTGTKSLEGFVNGVSQGTASTGFNMDVSNPNIGYGFFSRFLNRSVNGKLDAVAFSTFTGDFDPSSDFRLPIVPEPSSVALVAIALGGLALVRRK